MDVQPIPPVLPKKSFTWIWVILFLISTGIAGWLYYQKQQLKQQIALIAETPSPQVSPSTTILNSSPSPTPSNSSFPQPPVVVFEPPLSSDQYTAQRAEIKQKVVDPFIDYYQYVAGGEYPPVSLLIQQQSNESIKAQYPYTILGIMSNGGTHGEALIQTNGILSWWTPTCMGPCDYSEEFKQKYPQIVSITNP
ncbi:hypothetical protein COW80_04335 [Candidatus Beckwithbacteria bacterium CG22_combo_CG10-13_8_21_14_all_01_47_9]|uniref:Uncharacterized protein n=3 Tax=Candidatus Beckwithiibacteriota TaxID=1752726 RepID=A0A2H0E0F2_9BACT|nr:MAG: hypothetical protein AUJ59_03945 [Candidatus Beckwithbacteria bacterium CG1_02_47_37]PIP87721.1 MAG: hypothetical protein COW80_04335 [Candidatus Beckwithbacteria bacterium CG22_combo_CG10-13_8_21_14_all_01_47_9]PJC66099.1 MAG: hypothetical protein CO018_03685 [Candidatus Beckwithbacteria bacterium CG_4_9_14_0_2_um_filter_47_11]